VGDEQIGQVSREASDALRTAVHGARDEVQQLVRHAELTRDQPRLQKVIALRTELLELVRAADRGQRSVDQRLLADVRHVAEKARQIKRGRPPKGGRFKEVNRGRSRSKDSR